MVKVRVNILIAEEVVRSVDAPVRINGIVETLLARGLHVERRLDTIGVIIGSIRRTKIDDLKRVAGVAEVSEAREVHGD
jgi:hypothetical protein